MSDQVRAAPRGPEVPRRTLPMTPRNRATLEFVLDNLVWFMLLAVLAIVSVTVPNYFQVGIFASIIEQSSFVGAMVTGILFCNAGIGMGIVLRPDWLMIPVSLLIALAAGGIIGSINGFLI